MSLLLSALLAAAPLPPSSLERLADDVTTQALRAQLEAPTGIFVEPPGPLSRALATVLIARLAKAQRAPVSIDATSAPDAEKRAREAGVRSLVRLSLSLEEGKLLARGDAFSTWVNFWSGSTPTRSGAGAAIASVVDGDTEATTLGGGAAPVAPTPAALELRVQPIATLTGLPAALTTGDLDGDGHAELLVLVNEELIAYQTDGKVVGRFELRAGAPSATPTREPFGALSVTAGKVTAWSGRRARAEVLTWSAGTFKSNGTADTISLDGLGTHPEPGVSRFSADATLGGKPLALSAPFQATATRQGVTLLVLADGTASVFRGVAPTTRVSGVGCGSALLDVDGDGTPEVLVSSTKASGDTDELKLFSLSAFEALQARAATLGEGTSLWQLGVTKGRVIAASSAELDGAAGDEAVLATWSTNGTGELLLVRKVAP